MKYSPRKAYVFPPSRAKMIIIGALASLLLVVYFLFDTGFRQGVFLSRGPLSSNHAGFQENCESCHVLKGDVADEKCSVCHEKTGDRTGVYSYSAHYIYRSHDNSRVQTASAEYGGDEMACYSCHSEHMGRDAQITNVPDVKCLTCHGGSEFESGHPEFDFMSEKNHDDSSLAFTHIRHTGWVLEKMVKEEGAAL
ncbi:MAG: hypothetical protein IIB00_08100, partial [candidate division Zixibacteria bacterium]|nr:hypothetical protein [candidate division Zixibacteria bacterium]